MIFIIDDIEGKRVVALI